MKICKHCNESFSSKTPGMACFVCKNGLFRYGMNRLDQIKLLEKQNGQCALCPNPLVLFANRKGGFIDHDHSTNRIRGILCLPCNSLLGYLTNKKIDPRSILAYITPPDEESS